MKSFRSGAAGVSALRPLLLVTSRRFVQWRRLTSASSHPREIAKQGDTFEQSSNRHEGVRRMEAFEFGLDTFLPVTVDRSGQPIGGDQAIRNAVEEAVLAEAVGIDSFNIGEHYRAEFMDSAADVVLATIAGRTTRIRLGTAVTVLSTQDPVRLYANFATLDAVSNGRAQLIVGRGSSIESFPLFGFDLTDYEELFEERLDLLVRLPRPQP